MIDLIREHWFLSILGTLVVGALGSGLWEVAFRPFFRKLGEVLFFVLTLGMKKASDSVYKDAAKGYREQGGMFISQHFVALASAVIIATTFVMYKQTSYISIPEQAYLECEGLETPCEKKQCVKEIIKEKLTWLIPILIIASTLLVIILLYSYLWMSRVNHVITDFKQYLSICKPFITNDQIILLEQSFALLNNKDDFKLLTKELSNIAEANHLKLPRLNN